jgi:hypothetical protein
MLRTVVSHDEPSTAVLAGAEPELLFVDKLAGRSRENKRRMTRALQTLITVA